MDDYLRVGVIATTHGVRGEAKIYSTTDNLERFKTLKHCILDTGKEYIELEVEGLKFFKKYAILKFRGIDSINDIEKFRGKDLLVTRENAVELSENEYFITDLIGSKVVLENGDILGELSDVMTSVANAVFIVTTSSKKEILLPFIKECILEIDLEKKIVTAFLMPGLV